VLKVPQIGWNSLTYPNKGRLFKGIDEDSYVYFVHSYYLDADDKSIVTATTEYGTTIDASVEKGNVFACQFHPEKSAEVGMEILKNFLSI
jgi:glutamine amidotransferase